jgi:prepilin peptidase CpaA
MVPELSAIHIAILFGAAVLLVVAAVSDAKRFRIPNTVCAALLLLFPLFVITAPGTVEWRQHLMVFILLLVLGFGAFSVFSFLFGTPIMGAGDFKLLAATSLWAGPHFLALFLIIAAMAGGALALVVAIRTHIRNIVAVAKADKAEKGEGHFSLRSFFSNILSAEDAVALAKVPIPYGVAIAAGGLSTMYMLSQPILFPR